MSNTYQTTHIEQIYKIKRKASATQQNLDHAPCNKQGGKENEKRHLYVSHLLIQKYTMRGKSVQDSPHSFNHSKKPLDSNNTLYLLTKTNYLSIISNRIFSSPVSSRSLTLLLLKIFTLRFDSGAKLVAFHISSTFRPSA